MQPKNFCTSLHQSICLILADCLLFFRRDFILVAMAKLFIPVLLGTIRPKRESIKAAQLVEEVGKKITDITVQLVDPSDYHFPFDGNDPENKDPRYTEITAKADGFFIVTPEYNHSFPGTLKRMLDSELSNYIHKPVAFAGVSNGIFGGARAIEALVNTVREMGMVVTFSDVYFPQVQNLFDEKGKIKDEGYVRRIKRGYEELIWMAKALKWGRENLESIYH
jgi:NAD(P)H-dependent FMN reductase